MEHSPKRERNNAVRRQGKGACGAPLQLLIFTLLSLLLPCSVMAETGYEPENELSRELSLPVSIWPDLNTNPRAILVAVHGLVMHGGSFDVFARRLASRNFLVVAPDLRGYGRWLRGGNALPAGTVVDYEQSQADLVRLLDRLNADYPGVPIFCLGESLGADICIGAIVEGGCRVDGVVLSSPALKFRHIFCKELVGDLGLACIRPTKQINLTPYIRLCASEDQHVIAEMIEDPLVRKHLSSMELLKSQLFIWSTRKRIAQLPENLPVLIIQGDADRLLKSNAVVVLLKHLKSKDQTVRWFHKRGHVLLETAFAQPDTISSVEGWLVQHARQGNAWTAQTGAPGGE